MTRDRIKMAAVAPMYRASARQPGIYLKYAKAAGREGRGLLLLL